MKTIAAFAFLACVFFTACGGGASSEEDSPPPPIEGRQLHPLSIMVKSLDSDGQAGTLLFTDRDHFMRPDPETKIILKKISSYGETAVLSLNSTSPLNNGAGLSVLLTYGKIEFEPGQSPRVWSDTVSNRKIFQTRDQLAQSLRLNKGHWQFYGTGSFNFMVSPQEKSEDGHYEIARMRWTIPSSKRADSQMILLVQCVK